MDLFLADLFLIVQKFHTIFVEFRFVWDGLGVISALLFNCSTAEESFDSLSERHDNWRGGKNRRACPVAADV